MLWLQTSAVPSWLIILFYYKYHVDQRIII
jgi:hypothetical protein